MKELQQSFGFHQQVILEFLFGSVGRKSSSAQPSLPRSFCVGDWVTGYFCVVMLFTVDSSALFLTRTLGSNTECVLIQIFCLQVNLYMLHIVVAV